MHVVVVVVVPPNVFTFYSIIEKTKRNFPGANGVCALAFKVLTGKVSHRFYWWYLLTSSGKHDTLITVHKWLAENTSWWDVISSRFVHNLRAQLHCKQLLFYPFHTFIMEIPWQLFSDKNQYWTNARHSVQSETMPFWNGCHLPLLTLSLPSPPLLLLLLLLQM